MIFLKVMPVFLFVTSLPPRCLLRLCQERFLRSKQLRSTNRGTGEDANRRSVSAILPWGRVLHSVSRSIDPVVNRLLKKEHPSVPALRATTDSSSRHRA
jgi:hypothetical protein